MTEIEETPGSTADPLDDLRTAAHLIRSNRGFTGDALAGQFWRGIAAMFEQVAEGFENTREPKTPGYWSRFNEAASTARAYLDTGGQL